MTDGSRGAFNQATGRNLEDTSGADQRRYRAFQLELIEPHCGPSVLEVGAGLGEFAAQLTGRPPRHLPAAMVRAIGWAARPVAPGLARIARQAIAMEHLELTRPDPHHNHR